MKTSSILFTVAAMIMGASANTECEGKKEEGY
jgi:hypothetical protein